MKLRTPFLEVTGITDVWVNRISHWKRSGAVWRKVAGGPGFNSDPNTQSVLSYIKTASDFHNMIQGYLDKEFPEIENCDGFHPRMYRCWISGSTLNIVQRKITKKNGYWRCEDE